MKRAKYHYQFLLLRQKDCLRLKKEIKKKGVALRGGGADEAPECYKKLYQVLAFHEGTIETVHRLRPVGVAMATPDMYDPYKD